MIFQFNYFDKLKYKMNARYWYLVIGIILSFIFDSIENSFLYYFGILVFLILLLSIFFIPTKKILLPIFILLFLAKDTTQSSEEFESKGIILSATPWQQPILGVSPATIIAIWLLLILIRLNNFKFKITQPLFFFYFFIFITILSFFWGYPQDNLGRFMVDLKTPIYFFVSASIFRSYFIKFPDEILKITEIILFLIASRVLLDLLYLITNFGDKLNSTNYLSLDSTKGTILILMFYLIIKTLIKKSFFINSIFISLSFSVLLAYQTKWLILMFFLGLFILFLLIDFKLKLEFLIVFGFFNLLVIPILFLSFPKVFELLKYRFSGLSNFNFSNEISEIDLIRSSSIINSVNELFTKNSLLTGLGYGSWFTDNYLPMPNVNTSSFEESSILSGRYYRIHDYFFFFLFKFGLVGLFLFTKNYFTPIFKLISLSKRLKINENSKIFILVITTTSFSILTSVFWTGKGLILIALFTILPVFWIKLISTDFNE